LTEAGRTLRQDRARRLRNRRINNSSREPTIVSHAAVAPSVTITNPHVAWGTELEAAETLDTLVLTATISSAVPATIPTARAMTVASIRRIPVELSPEARAVHPRQFSDELVTGFVLAANLGWEKGTTRGRRKKPSARRSRRSSGRSRDLGGKRRESLAKARPRPRPCRQRGGGVGGGDTWLDRLRMLKQEPDRLAR
jgi:hypothetical protein